LTPRPETPAPPSDAEIDRLRAGRGGPWRAIRWIHQRRPILTAVIALAAPAHALAAAARPVDLLADFGDARFWIAWILMLFGTAVRIWGSGNLRKNREVTDTGVYQLVRHPLYTGSLSFFLAYFLTVGDPLVGIGLFGALVLLVYYPTMLGEEEYLELKFPAQVRARPSVPRLVPNPLRLPMALRTDRFSAGTARRNLGLRSVAFILFLPIFLKLLILLQGTL
jgi:protein-S-isoprenylcysteine O-methyltransferase Ste14